jgi:hypothetical protein
MILSTAAGKPEGRIAIGAFFVLWLFFAFTFLGGRDGSTDSLKAWTGYSSSPAVKLPISYNLQVPPKVGCEAVVNDLQSRLIESYADILKGVRYANIWGYLGL